ncbi:3-isopropylmalate dehydratase [Powellomyces hirtus]|uniref:Aconitate hydratase, mitochondrial n=1 Tax=Powellomyces hirtus TaxID=109895 RepID=A0A507DZT2_9FUNG|nr:3-isopropylmalate dehydratase [Powellomyces hirtus]
MHRFPHPNTLLRSSALARRSRTRARTLATLTATPDSRIPNYKCLIDNLATVRKIRLSSSADSQNLTLAEKILYSHLPASHCNDPITPIVRGDTYLKLSPDRVAMQDASAQMALLQFMLAKRPTTAVPSSIHCDHLIAAHRGANADVAQSAITNEEIFHFLSSAAHKYGIAFWGPGSGIIHQIVLENYAAPGTLMLGTDSHTPNAGGLGMLAIGVGGADAVDAMAGIPWELKAPKILGVRLTGKLQGWTSPKDVILHLAGLLTVRGATNHIIEYFGPGAETLSCTGMATMCNMGAEVGATTSTFPYSPAMSQYLRATHRAGVADAADQAHAAGFLSADAGAAYDKVIEINLSTLEPHINGPFTPDLATPLSKFKDFVTENGWEDKISVSLIGSCTNSSYEDMQRSASLAQQAIDAGVVATESRFLITPGSEQIRATIERDGVTKVLESVGGKVLANACGPCIGQWKRTEEETETPGTTATPPNAPNAILTSFNRNFKSRNDGNAKTMNFLASPELVTAMAFAGKLTFNPTTDSLPTRSGKPFTFSPPAAVPSLPTNGFTPGREGYTPPPATSTPHPTTTITVDPASTRLQLLTPFQAWHGREFTDLLVLGKFVGKCTTDHISAAGAWLKYKGHLDNIANNTLIGAHNAFTDAVNSAVNELPTDHNTNPIDTIPNVARHYKHLQAPWCVIADHNYGEGSAREHAALQPRYLGCQLIVARSFARIHETNLKKQGVLPLTFADPADYDKINRAPPSSSSSSSAPTTSSPLRISTRGVVDLLNGTNTNQQLYLVLTRDGSTEETLIPVNHSLSADQAAWIRAGSALNLIAQNA